MEEGVAEKKEHDLTAILHLGPPATIAGSPSSEVLKSFEKISDEARQIVEKLAPEDAMLIVHRGPGQGSRFLVTGIGATIGRSPESDIFLDDVTVSRKHAQVLKSMPGFFTLKDLGSLNGTYVNGKHVVEISLVNGDEIQIGKFHMLFLGGKK
jgi:pSer/pThr/pTyr-binding forkhead associated (FHA) protein